ncbi:tetratricopeptide repeat protein [Solimonas sp. K1W22B-7]|uniref:PA2778 family cysteine peptidase n=1 Tax=Solimonas sp. K1W22B-7 TaxID=2303331 RepID=UPI000E331916|nr:PA2778 family cysteine peptidase [Solimonas sp. K1W22B-7]AXQ29688.1 tetratricopeptide repeat protein [Solimonas sp. K1W22B-7]
MRRLLVACAALALVACAASPPMRAQWPPATAGVELTATPFFPQTRYQCGPAALATALAASGVAVTPDELAPQVYLPGRRGSLQLELVAAARRQQRLAYPLKPDPAALLAELASGQPVLVLQNLGVSWLPVWHYAVVIGADPVAETVVLRSGTDRRRVMRWNRFMDSWRRADQWAVVVTPMDRVPVSATALDWLGAAAAFEQLGQLPLATIAYEAASRRWGDATLAWQLLGNARYRGGDLAGARRAFQRAVELKPEAAAYNNLAQVELELGCRDAAAAALAQAESLTATPAVASVIAQTRAALAAAPSNGVCMAQ